jgi:hypothetical protein
MGFRLVPFLILCLVSWNMQAAFAQKPGAAPQFVIDADRPFVYLKFVRYGPGIPFRDDEPKERIWFKLVNNCKVPIVIETLGVPDGSLANEVGLIHRVVRDERWGLIVDAPPPPPMPSLPPGLTDFPPAPPAVSEADRKPEEMPAGYRGGDVYSTQPICLAWRRCSAFRGTT